MEAEEESAVAVAAVLQNPARVGLEGQHAPYGVPVEKA